MASRSYKHIIAVVVWYHPSDKEVDAIRLYHNEVAEVIVVDNSDQDNAALLTGLTHVTYLPLRSNQGIAKALNVGCQLATEHGADWIITMDQDSRWDQSSIADYLQETLRYPDWEQVALFSPFHDCNGQAKTQNAALPDYEQRLYLMCSGNLLRSSAWQQAPFRNDFFIDFVDYEFCFHLDQLGWQLVRTNRVLLSHSLGNQPVSVGKRRTIYPHPAWRYYYIGRNIRRLIRLYPRHMFSLLNRFRKTYRDLRCFDGSDDKEEKISALLRGWRDGRQPLSADGPTSAA